MSRREDRRRPVREERGNTRDNDPRPARDDRGNTSGRGEALNDFFMDGKGINREVLQREICKYLGPEAFSRPYNYNGVSGFTITAVRPFTSKMIDDLQDLSRSYVNENREAVRKGQQDVPYAQSKTALQANVRNQGMDDEYDQYPSHTPYTMPSAQSGYPASSRAEYPPTQGGAYPGSMYSSPGPGYAQGLSYGQASTYSSSTRPGTIDYNPSYGSDQYGDESPRPSYPSGARREPRSDIRMEPREPRDPRDPRDLRDIRDPREMRDLRPEPRGDPRLDPRGVDPRAYAVAQPRMDYGDIRDSRIDPRVPAYSYPVNSPADVQMRGYNDDYPTAPVQMGRGGPAYAPPSRVVQTGYDPRDAAQIRDAYRHEPIREERRRR